MDQSTNERCCYCSSEAYYMTRGGLPVCRRHESKVNARANYRRSLGRRFNDALKGKARRRPA